MSKILLLGGTGAMGANLSRRLAERGENVWITSRRKMVDSGRARFICGNAKDREFLRDTFQKLRPDAVVDFMCYGSGEFSERKDVLLNGTGQYVFISSCRVFAGEETHTERSPRLLDVCTDSEYLKTDEYALAKARSENMLRDSGRQNWTIVRPCITYAYPRLQFGCLEASAFLPRVQQGLPVPIPVEMMQKRTTMLHGDAVAEMIARLLCNSKAIGEDFNTVTSENHTWGEIADYYAALIGMKIQHCSLDDYELFCNPWQVKYGRMVHHCFDNSKVLAVTGLKQEKLSSLQAMLSQETAKFIQSGFRGQVDVYRNAIIDRVLKTRFCVSGGLSSRLMYARHRYAWVERMISVARNLI